MRVCAVIIVILGIVIQPTIRAIAEIPYEESYASQLWTEDYYEILRRSNDARIREKPAAPWKENLAAQPFIRGLRKLERPDFEAYASLDVNENPIAVLWAQFALAREGTLDAVSIPDHFLHLLFLSLGFYGNLMNREDDHLISRLTLDAFGRLSRDNFLREYYDPAYRERYGRIWQMDIPTHAINLSTYDPDYVHQWLYDLLLLKNDISAWYWDREFAEKMVNNYAYNAFDEDDVIHRKHFYDDEAGKWMYRERHKTPLEITRDMAFTVLTMFENHESLTEIFRQLCPDLAHAYWERTTAIFEGLAAYAETPLRDEKWMAEICHNIELRLNGVLSWSTDLRDIGKYRKSYKLEQMPVRHVVREQYEQLELSIEEEGCRNQMEQLKDLLLQEEYCLNYYVIKRLSSDDGVFVDESFWSEWREVVGRVLDKHYHFERCIGHLARIRVCQEYGGYLEDLLELTAKINYLTQMIPLEAE